MKKILKSRTLWTLLVMFVLGGVQAMQPFLPADLFVLVQAILTFMAGYFKLSPSQNYN